MDYLEYEVLLVSDVFLIHLHLATLVALHSHYKRELQNKTDH